MTRGIDPVSSGFPSLREVERRQIRRALEVCGWNREEAAGRLGIGRATIYRKIGEHELAPPGAAKRSRARSSTKH